MKRLDDFDNIFVNVMLALFIGLMSGGAVGLVVKSDPTKEAILTEWEVWPTIVLFVLLLLFILKYLQGMSVLRYRFNSGGDGLAGIVPTRIQNLILFFSRILFLGALYYLVYLLFFVKTQATGVLLRVIIFGSLVFFGYALPSLCLRLMVRDGQQGSWPDIIVREFREGLHPCGQRTNLRGVFQTWCALNGINVLLILVSGWLRPSFEWYLAFFLLMNTIGDWLLNREFYFGHNPMPVSSGTEG